MDKRKFRHSGRASTSASVSQSLKLRLLIDRSKAKVLYAEAEKPFVDLLLSFLKLPAASIFGFLSALSGNEGNVGSLSTLYESVEELQTSVLCSENLKQKLLKPNIDVSPSLRKIMKIENTLSSNSVSNLYCCSEAATHSCSTRSGGICDCLGVRSYVMRVRDGTCNKTEGNARVAEEGYVKDNVTFIVTDDLRVFPSSTIASVSWLNQMKVEKLSDLEERVENVGPDQVVKLLKAMLVSQTALNDVFGHLACPQEKKRRRLPARRKWRRR